MIFGIGPGEFIGLALIAIIFVGPERLPKFSSDAAKFLKKVKNLNTVGTKKTAQLLLKKLVATNQKQFTYNVIKV